jgi:hypothetical protein
MRPQLNCTLRKSLKRPRYLHHFLRSCLLPLGTLQIAVLLVAFEPRAQAYVDPGSGFVFLQVAGSMFAGAIYDMRHRVKRMVNSIRRSSQVAPTAGKIDDSQQ